MDVMQTVLKFFCTMLLKTFLHYISFVNILKLFTINQNMFKEYLDTHFVYLRVPYMEYSEMIIVNINISSDLSVSVLLQHIQNSYLPVIIAIINLCLINNSIKLTSYCSHSNFIHCSH